MRFLYSVLMTKLSLPNQSLQTAYQSVGKGRVLADHPRSPIPMGERDGVWLLDFNCVHNPFCAYSDAYECPLVSFENHLDVRIEAGERYAE